MEIVLRSAAVFFVIFLLLRAMGRRELSEVTAFELVILVVIGDLVQQGVTQSDQSLTGATIVIATMCLLTVGTAYMSFRFRRLRPLLEGDPIVLIAGGQIQERALRRQRITDDELAAEARLQQIGSLREVRFAILESSGKISFITKSG
jgi:uncharacterized membrane protein YcaP (DUF421 family)